MTPVTYAFTKIAGGGKIVSSDGSTYEATTGNQVRVSLGKAGNTLVVKMDGQTPTVECTLAQISSIAGSAAPVSLALAIDAIVNSVFPKAASSVSISPGAVPTDADYTAVVNTAIYLPNNTITSNRNFVVPAGSNLDPLEIYNNETAFLWNLTGAPIYLSDGVTTMASLAPNTNYLIRMVSGKWRILN